MIVLPPVFMLLPRLGPKTDHCKKSNPAQIPDHARVPHPRYSGYTRDQPLGATSSSEEFDENARGGGLDYSSNSSKSKCAETARGDRLEYSSNSSK